MKRTLVLAGGAAAALSFLVFVVAPTVFVVASGGRTNPPVEHQVAWDSPQTRALFYQACADCHSHETRWPWYSMIPPFSALVVWDVREGRKEFNISVPDMGEADEAAELVYSGDMPLPIYTITHPEARLDTARRKAFAEGLAKTFGGEVGEHEHDDHD